MSTHRWRNQNRVHTALTNKEFTHWNKVKVMMHYSDGIPICRNCGEQDIDVLCIDHIYGGGAKQRQQLGRRGHDFYDWLIKAEFPKGNQVLCYNCNTRKAWVEICTPVSTHKPKNVAMPEDYKVKSPYIRPK